MWLRIFRFISRFGVVVNLAVWTVTLNYADDIVDLFSGADADHEEPGLFWLTVSLKIVLALLIERLMALAASVIDALVGPVPTAVLDDMRTASAKFRREHTKLLRTGIAARNFGQRVPRIRPSPVLVL